MLSDTPAGAAPVPLEPLSPGCQRSRLAGVLERGCRIWLTPPPFDHSKLMLVDDSWAMIGSANWDPRSLRLNFELNLECYGKEFARDVADIIARKMKNSWQITLHDVDSRPISIRLRDGLARLLSPYL